MIKLFKPLISLLRLYRKVKNIKIAYQLLPLQFTPGIDTAIKTKGDKIDFTGYNKTFTRRQLDLFGNHGELLLKYIKSKNVSFVPDQPGELISVSVNGKNVFLSANNYDSLKVIEEIFIDQLYNFGSPDQYVVCDAGMNIAAASLYFASFDNIEKVYGYEPFPETCTLANKNIALNTGISNKIESLNLGLGAKDTVSDVPLPADGFLGGTTTDFFIRELPENLKQKSIRVEIKNVSAVIRDIKSNHPGKKIILKLDCEGAEYEIMDELEKSNMLDDIAVYMIEFHFKGNKHFIEMLLKKQFCVLSPANEDVNPFGMLYAIKL